MLMTNKKQEQKRQTAVTTTTSSPSTPTPTPTPITTSSSSSPITPPPPQGPQSQSLPLPFFVVSVLLRAVLIPAATVSACIVLYNTDVIKEKTMLIVAVIEWWGVVELSCLLLLSLLSKGRLNHFSLVFLICISFWESLTFAQCYCFLFSISHSISHFILSHLLHQIIKSSPYHIITISSYHHYHIISSHHPAPRRPHSTAPSSSSCSTTAGVQLPLPSSSIRTSLPSRRSLWRPSSPSASRSREHGGDALRVRWLGVDWGWT